MSALVKGSDRIVPDEGADPSAGTVHWAPDKSLWIGGMTTAGVVLGPLFFS